MHYKINNLPLILTIAGGLLLHTCTKKENEELFETLSQTAKSSLSLEKTSKKIVHTKKFSHHPLFDTIKTDPQLDINSEEYLAGIHHIHIELLRKDSAYAKFCSSEKVGEAFAKYNNSPEDAYSAIINEYATQAGYLFIYPTEYIQVFDKPFLQIEEELSFSMKSFPVFHTLLGIDENSTKSVFVVSDTAAERMKILGATLYGMPIVRTSCKENLGVVGNELLHQIFAEKQLIPDQDAYSKIGGYYFPNICFEEFCSDAVKLSVETSDLDTSTLQTYSENLRRGLWKQFGKKCGYDFSDRLPNYALSHQFAPDLFKKYATEKQKNDLTALEKTLINDLHKLQSTKSIAALETYIDGNKLLTPEEKAQDTIFFQELKQYPEYYAKAALNLVLQRYTKSCEEQIIKPFVQNLTIDQKQQIVDDYLHFTKDIISTFSREKTITTTGTN